MVSSEKKQITQIWSLLIQEILMGMESSIGINVSGVSGGCFTYNLNTQKKNKNHSIKLFSLLERSSKMSIKYSTFGKKTFKFQACTFFHNSLCTCLQEEGYCPYISSLWISACFLVIYRQFWVSNTN